MRVQKERKITEMQCKYEYKFNNKMNHQSNELEIERSTKTIEKGKMSVPENWRRKSEAGRKYETQAKLWVLFLTIISVYDP